MSQFVIRIEYFISHFLQELGVVAGVCRHCFKVLLYFGFVLGVGLRFVLELDYGVIYLGKALYGICEVIACVFDD